MPHTSRLAVGGPAGETTDFDADYKFSPLERMLLTAAVCTEMPAPPSSRALLLGGGVPTPPAAERCCWGGGPAPPSSSALLLGGAGISVQTAAVSSMRSSCENLWSASKSVVSPAGPPTANRAVRGSPGRAAWLAPRRCPPLRRRVAADLTVLPGDGRARVFEKRKGSPLLTAQSIDLRRASDPRIERVADRLGRSALIDQRQRDARVSGSLYPCMTLSYACGSNKIDSDGHRSLVKRQHSTARRCIGLEGAVNTTASSPIHLRRVECWRFTKHL